jgi:hypothetical protein
MADNSDVDIEEMDATIEHTEIRSWVEEHGGVPAHVESTEGEGDPGLLRVGFTDAGPAERLTEITWDEFFQEFEEGRLAFVYRDEPPRDGSRPAVRLVNRDRVKDQL